MCSATRFRYQELEAALEAELLDSGEDGERRVVDHDAALWELDCLVVLEALPALAHVPSRARLLAGIVAPPSRGMEKAPPERGLLN